MYLNVEILENAERRHAITYGPIDERVRVSGAFDLTNKHVHVRMTWTTDPLKDPLPLPVKLIETLQGMMAACTDEVEILLAGVIQQWEDKQEPFMLIDFLKAHNWQPGKPGYSKVWKNLPIRMRECGFTSNRKRRQRGENPVQVWVRKEIINKYGC